MLYILAAVVVVIAIIGGGTALGILPGPPAP